MSQGRQFVAWQPLLTDHASFTLDALGRLSGRPVIAYASMLEDSTRKAQGWTGARLGQVLLRQLPRRGFFRFALARLRAHRDDVHLFGSPFQEPRLIACAVLAAWSGSEVYLISEPYSPRAEGYLQETGVLQGRLRAWLRPLLYRFYVHLLRPRLAGVFTISSLAFAQYRQAGLPTCRLFPFGYFVPGESLPPRTRPAAAGPLRLVFVGTLIRRKGLDLLLAAQRRLHERGVSVQLDVFGPGDPTSWFSATEAGVRYGGKIPFGTAQEVIARYDCLVLPSRYDGWGVVVNEALCAGVPVVCSDAVGAHSVVEAFQSGKVVPGEDPAALADCLLQLATEPGLLERLRSGAHKAAEKLQPAVAAAYLAQIVLSPPAVRPTIGPPWYPRPE